jgi:hypothetical protein
VKALLDELTAIVAAARDREGVLEAQAAVQSGRMTALWEERFGERPERRLDDALERVQTWKRRT